MKRYEFIIPEWSHDDIFAPVRSKIDCIRLLMKTLKLIEASPEITEQYEAGKIELVIARMSRVFYFSENKYFSICFPFSVRKNDEGFIFYKGDIDPIDSFLTSLILSFLPSDDHLDLGSAFDFASSTSDRDYEIAWPLLRELLMHEDGYIRYDHDPLHENHRLHPLNHLDVFYSSAATFKLGMSNRIAKEALVDLLKRETDCAFLNGF